MFKVNQIWRKIGPLGAIKIVARTTNGWIVEVFDFQLKTVMDDELFRFEESGKRINIRRTLVPGNDPLAPFNATQLYCLN